MVEPIDLSVSSRLSAVVAPMTATRRLLSTEAELMNEPVHMS